ncbi:MAG: hypothetical protein D6694_10130 [Gammaproteobacteria bacterium]|nr:MAG: hypothetical protein D6694_10130 [Gammaproteobacteria bacterium]
MPGGGDRAHLRGIREPDGSATILRSGGDAYEGGRAVGEADGGTGGGAGMGGEGGAVASATTAHRDQVAWTAGRLALSVRAGLPAEAFAGSRPASLTPSLPCFVVYLHFTLSARMFS